MHPKDIRFRGAPRAHCRRRAACHRRYHWRQSAVL